MDRIASTDFGAGALQSRLSNLHLAGSNRIARDRSQLSTSGDGTDDAGPSQNSLPRGREFEHPGSNLDSSSTSAPISRRVSEEDEEASGPVAFVHIEYSAARLARVPSYSTAIQSNPTTSVNDGLPTYQSAVRASQASQPSQQP